MKKFGLVRHREWFRPQDGWVFRGFRIQGPVMKTRLGAILVWLGQLIG